MEVAAPPKPHSRQRSSVLSGLPPGTRGQSRVESGPARHKRTLLESTAPPLSRGGMLLRAAAGTCPSQLWGPKDCLASGLSVCVERCAREVVGLGGPLTHVPQVAPGPKSCEPFLAFTSSWCDPISLPRYPFSAPDPTWGSWALIPTNQLSQAAAQPCEDLLKDRVLSPSPHRRSLRLAFISGSSAWPGSFIRF